MILVYILIPNCSRISGLYPVVPTVTGEEIVHPYLETYSSKVFTAQFNRLLLQIWMSSLMMSSILPSLLSFVPSLISCEVVLHERLREFDCFGWHAPLDHI